MKGNAMLARFIRYLEAHPVRGGVISASSAILGLALVWTTVTAAKALVGRPNDDEQIKATAQNFVEKWQSGDREGMYRLISPAQKRPSEDVGTHRWTRLLADLRPVGVFRIAAVTALPRRPATSARVVLEFEGDAGGGSDGWQALHVVKNDKKGLADCRGRWFVVAWTPSHVPEQEKAEIRLDEFLEGMPTLDLPPVNRTSVQATARRFIHLWSGYQARAMLDLMEPKAKKPGFEGKVWSHSFLQRWGPPAKPLEAYYRMEEWYERNGALPLPAKPAQMNGCMLWVRSSRGAPGDRGSFLLFRIARADDQQRLTPGGIWRFQASMFPDDQRAEDATPLE